MKRLAIFGTNSALPGSNSRRYEFTHSLLEYPPPLPPPSLPNTSERQFVLKIDSKKNVFGRKPSSTSFRYFRFSYHVGIDIMERFFILCSYWKHKMWSSWHVKPRVWMCASCVKATCSWLIHYQHIVIRCIFNLWIDCYGFLEKCDVKPRFWFCNAV